MVALRQEDGRRRSHTRVRLRFIDAEPEPMLEPLPLVRRDTLPEHVDYRDTGCELSPSCQHCPLEHCKYDAPVTLRRAMMAARDREIAVLRRRHRAPIDMLAETYGVTTRTIFRILSEQRR
ncbi:MAG: hypothetical protein M3P30_04355 [Chloroflexota bacterium]|nr:hypothetical protein [Chloroflexota bacterium]